jgi:uncharacterized membrane protein
MIHSPAGIVSVLLLIEGTLLFLASYRHTEKVFRYLPVMFWIYFVPMLANTFGLIPAESETAVYGVITRYGLPGSLVLLLLSSDIAAIIKLGKAALAVMLAGSLGIVLGGPAVFLIFKPWLPSPDFWMGFGALSGSWIGGSANMIAVKEAIGTPQEIFLPMVVVDTICPYTWMFMLIVLARYQGVFDRWNRADLSIVDDLTRKHLEVEKQKIPLTVGHSAALAALAAAGTVLSLGLAGFMPEIEKILTVRAWPIIIATALGIGLSFTPLRKLERRGASKVGYALLYFVLASIGATTNLAALASAPVLIAAGFVWMTIHGLFILASARALRVPMSLMAAASQANVGGAASTPVLADIYRPGLAPVGLLLAVLGNIIGTYLGIVCSVLCRMAAQWTIYF